MWFVTYIKVGRRPVPNKLNNQTSTRESSSLSPLDNSSLFFKTIRGRENSDVGVKPETQTQNGGAGKMAANSGVGPPWGERGMADQRALKPEST